MRIPSVGGDGGFRSACLHLPGSALRLDPRRVRRFPASLGPFAAVHFRACIKRAAKNDITRRGRDAETTSKDGVSQGPESQRKDGSNKQMRAIELIGSEGLKSLRLADDATGDLCTR